MNVWSDRNLTLVVSSKVTLVSVLYVYKWSTFYNEAIRSGLCFIVPLYQAWYHFSILVNHFWLVDDKRIAWNSRFWLVEELVMNPCLMFRRIIFEWIYTLVIHLGIRILQKSCFSANNKGWPERSPTVRVRPTLNGTLSKMWSNGLKLRRSCQRFLAFGQNHQLLKRSLLPTNQLMHHQLFEMVPSAIATD